MTRYFTADFHLKTIKEYYDRDAFAGYEYCNQSYLELSKARGSYSDKIPLTLME